MREGATFGFGHLPFNLTLSLSLTHHHLYVLFDEIKGTRNQDLCSCWLSDSPSPYSLVPLASIYLPVQSNWDQLRLSLPTVDHQNYLQSTYLVRGQGNFESMGQTIQPEDNA